MPVCQKYDILLSQLLNYNRRDLVLFRISYRKALQISCSFSNINVPCAPPRGNM